MTRFWDALATVEDWLAVSDGRAIAVAGHPFAFRRRAAVSTADAERIHDLVVGVRLGRGPDA